VQIYEVGCADGVHFLAQEYVAGQNLRQFLARSGPLETKLAVNIMRQVAAALHKSSQRAIVHRDIKPENIMLANNGEVKVADFGLARFARDGAGVDLTQVGVTMGTPLYMSPEQVEGRTLDPRSDIYSFGVTCYHMLAGRPPFEGDTALSVAIQHVKKEPARLEDLRPDLPGGLCRTIHKMLAKNPADRHQQPAELLRDLRTLQIEGLPDDWSPERDDWGTPELIALADARIEATQRLDAVMKSETTRGGRSRIWLLAAGALAAFLAGTACAWLTRPSPLLQLPADQTPQIERRASAREQYFFVAVPLGAEAALKSVEQYFPPDKDPMNEYYVRLSKQRLADLYLANEEFDKALAYYSELANIESETQFQAFGLVGQANVYALQGDKTRAYEKLASLKPVYDKLRQPNLRYELRRQLEPDLRTRFDRQVLEDRGGQQTGGKKDG
jgi:serine/threonine-protein kinase